MIMRIVVEMVCEVLYCIYFVFMHGLKNRQATPPKKMLTNMHICYFKSAKTAILLDICSHPMLGF